MNTHYVEFDEGEVRYGWNIFQVEYPEPEIIEECFDQYHHHIYDCLDCYESGLNEDDTDFLQFSLDKVYDYYVQDAEDSDYGPIRLEYIQKMASSLNLVLPKVSK